MATHRRRPLEVEAWQNDDAGPAMPYWLEQIYTRERGGILRVAIAADKSLPVYLGDWVVLRPDGIVSVIAAGAFEAEFESAEAMSLDRAREILRGMTLGDIEKMLARADAGETVPGLDAVDDAVGVLIDAERGH